LPLWGRVTYDVGIGCYPAQFFNYAMRPPLLLLSAAAALVACSAEQPPAATPRTVLVQSVTSAAANAGQFTGEIRARHEVDLAFRVGGKVTARLVDAGAEIKAGQPLAQLDPADLQLAASAAQAQLAAAETDYATARAERERYAGLLAQKFVSQAAYDAKHNAYSSAQGRLNQARAQSQLSGNQAAYGTLSSEFPAIVTAVLADRGQVVAAGQPVYRLARPEEKEVAIAVPESRLAEVRAAQTFAVNLWAEPKTQIRGELRELAPAADPVTRTYTARIRLLNPPPSLRLGMTAQVSLDGPAAAALQVPLSALVNHGQGAIVWVVSDGKAAPRPVRTGEFTETGVRVLDGLQAGEQVVITGTSQLVAGQAVQAQLAPAADRQR